MKIILGLILYLFLLIIFYVRGGLLELVAFLMLSFIFGILVTLLLLSIALTKKFFKKRKSIWKKGLFTLKSAVTYLLLIVFIFGGTYLTIYLDRFTKDKESLPNDQYLALIVADGASLIQARQLFMEGLPQEDYFKNISLAFPNISEYFIQKGAFTANGISTWPSSSIPAHTGIITGTYPRESGVMGQRQFDPIERKHTSYIGLGILQHENILSKNVKALCEYFPKVRSVDVLQIANRGCSLYVPGTPHDEEVIKRAKQVIKTTDFIGKYSGKNEIPKIMIMTLPDIDHETHNSLLSDEKSKELYLRTDKHIGEIFDLYKEKGIFNKTLFILAADHGMGEVKNHVTLDNLMHDLRFDTFQSLKWSVIPAWGSFEANFYVGSKYKFNKDYNSVPLWGGNSDGLIYIKGQIKEPNGKIKESWDIKATDEMLSSYRVGGTDINVIKRLLDYSPGVGLVFTNPEPNTFNVYSKEGKGQILERVANNRTEFKYQILKGKDPLEYSENNEIKKLIDNKKWLADEEWARLTYTEHYPDALRRISHSFENNNSATLHITAADGWDFTPYYVAKDVLVGSHGSLNSQQSLVPIMFFGPGVKNTEIPFARTVDILPTILAYFDLQISPNINGKPLPIFSDEIKNKEVIERSTSYRLDKSLSLNESYYILEDIYGSYDKRLIKLTKSNNKREVLVESIKQSLPHLNEKVNMTLELKEIDVSNKNLILQEIYVAEQKLGKTLNFKLTNNSF